MGYNKIFLQKLLYASFLTSFNVSLISLCYTYNNKWYLVQLPLLLIFLFEMVSILLILVLSAFKKDKRLPKEKIESRNICYFIPCYNQSQDEINNTMESFIKQSEIQTHNKIYVVVCDGRKRGAGNLLSTDQILSKNIFPNSKSIILPKGYANNQKQTNEIQILMGETSNKCPYFVIIKGKNQGKRDSIGIIRRLCLNFNKQQPDYSFVSQQALFLFKSHLQKYNITSIQYIVGVDADTVFQEDCTIQMLRQIQRKQNILATTGMVKVQFTADTYFGKLMEYYQHVEYIAGQGFMRNQQNLTQQKINCLPGCLNITRVCQKTCGQELLSIYMHVPNQEDHIFQWIRGTASEDRHSVMLLLKLYGDCHTTCTWDAQAITSVPITPSVFLSQRKRWSLGSATHGFWMIFMENIPLFERLSSLVFVLTYILTPFFMYSLVTWLNTIVRGNADKLFWIMTGLVQIISLYKLSIGVWLKMTAKERALYFLSYPLYYMCGPVVGICIWCYSLFHMDDFGWGKTRTIIQSPVQNRAQVGTTISESNLKQFSTTFQTTKYRTQINPHQINIKDQIVQQLDDEYRSEQIQPKLRNRSFQQSRAFEITLSGMQTPVVSVSLERTAFSQIENIISPNARTISNKPQILQTQYYITTRQNQASQSENMHESIVVFTQSDVSDVAQSEDQEMRTRTNTAHVTQRFQKAKVIQFQD